MSSKKVWRRPRKQDLQVGNVIPIKQESGEDIGIAKLLSRKPSRHKTDNLPICLTESKNDIQKDTMYLYSTERWLVEWIEHNYYRKGDRTHKEVLYYMGKFTDHPSYVDINLFGNRGCPPDSVVIFLEEECVLTLDGENYLPSAIKSLDRLKKGFNGELILFAHSPLQVKERWELNKIKHRIYDFLPTEQSFAEGIKEYIENNDIIDYAIISGVSRVRGSRVIQVDTTKGLILKQ